jgi:hypothetical protein
MTPSVGSRLARLASERPLLRTLAGVADRLLLRPRRRILLEYRYGRKHELGWVLVVLALTRDTPRSRVLRAMAQPGVEKLRSRWHAAR